MAIADIRKMMAVGVPAETAKVIDEVVTTASGGAVAWADVTGTQAGVEAAVAAKTSIAALANLTDNSGGTASGTIAVVGATYSQTEVANAIASLAAKINAINAALK